VNITLNGSDGQDYPLATEISGRDDGRTRRWSAHPGGIKTILLAVSMETPSSRVIDLATDLGRRLGATIVAFHVREWPFRGSEWVLGEGAFVEGKKEASRLLDQVICRLRSVGVRVRGITGGGRPGQVGHAIVDAANLEDADLIILGFHRHSLLEELLAGGVTRKVRRLSEVPVLTVPPLRAPSHASGNRWRSVVT